MNWRLSLIPWRIFLSKKSLFVALATFLLLFGSLRAWPRRSRGAYPMTQTSGDTAEGVSVSISTTTVTRLYTKATKHREILFQNSSSDYAVYCGTHSSVAADSGPRFFIPTKPGAVRTNGTYDIWCVGEGNEVSGTIEVLGVVEWDSGDGN